MRARWIGLAIAVALLAAAAAGQRTKRLPRYKIDPYTRNDPKLLARAGYVSYGPFAFGTRGEKPVTTTDIERHLGYARFIWVETAHFRIGSTLQAWTVPFDPATRKKIRAELGRLKQKLPRINPKKRTLDPWLRLHLIAMRMEDTYALVEHWLKVTEQDFPRDASNVIIGRGRYMGQGPYLGQPGKYLLLPFAKGSTYADFLETYIGRRSKLGQRWNFKLPGCMFYGVATDSDDGSLKHDTALHANLVFNVVHNLVDGFRFYAYDMPVWITSGLAHYFQRLISPRWNSFDENEGSMVDKKSLWRWRVATRKLLAAGKGAPFAEVSTWRDYGQISFRDHILVWSRWDFLMSMGRDKFSDFMFVVKGRVNASNWLADESNLVGAARTALKRAYGLTPLSFDEAWKAWVMKNYPTQ